MISCLQFIPFCPSYDAYTTDPWPWVELVYQRGKVVSISFTMVVSTHEFSQTLHENKKKHWTRISFPYKLLRLLNTVIRQKPLIYLLLSISFRFLYFSGSSRNISQLTLCLQKVPFRYHLKFTRISLQLVPNWYQ